MTSRDEAFRTITALVAMGDSVCIDDLPGTEVISSRDAEVAIQIGDLVRQLLGAFDYLESPEFLRSLAAKSPSYQAMKRKVEAEPVRRRAHYDRFRDSVANLVVSDEVFDLLPGERHAVLRELRALVSSLGNPS